MRLHRWTPFVILRPERYVSDDGDLWSALDIEEWSRCGYERVYSSGQIIEESVDAYAERDGYLSVLRRPIRRRADGGPSGRADGPGESDGSDGPDEPGRPADSDEADGSMTA